MASAKFSINADADDQGFDGTVGQVLTLRLKPLPVTGVSTVLFQVFAPDTFDDELPIARNPPRSSPGAAVLSLVGATTGQSVSPVAVDGSVTLTMPGTRGHAWIVRCVVNGGAAGTGGTNVNGTNGGEVVVYTYG